jgi:hypothetical protein
MYTTRIIFWIRRIVKNLRKSLQRQIFLYRRSIILFEKSIYNIKINLRKRLSLFQNIEPAGGPGPGPELLSVCKHQSHARLVAWPPAGAAIACMQMQLQAACSPSGWYSWPAGEWGHACTAVIERAQGPRSPQEAWPWPGPYRRACISGYLFSGGLSRCASPMEGKNQRYMLSVLSKIWYLRVVKSQSVFSSFSRINLLCEKNNVEKEIPTNSICLVLHGGSVCW